MGDCMTTGDLISRDALKRSIENAKRLGKNAIDYYIDQQQTVDAVPVVHGEWVWEDSVCSPRTCSVCKQKFYIGRGWNFCPNCGATMDGKEQSDE